MFNSEKFVLIGENLYLDFVNTKLLQNGKPYEMLAAKEDFLGWAIAVGLIKNNKAKVLLKNFIENDFKEIIDYRNSLNQMTFEIVSGKIIQPRFIEAINKQLKRQIGFEKLEMSGNNLTKKFVASFEKAVELLTPISQSAVDVLISENSDNLKKCESEECVLYFIDTSKNHSRRWCSMKACGNRAKANAFYQRNKAKI